MRLISAVVLTACACAIIERVTRLIRATRSDVAEYQIVEFAKPMRDSRSSYIPEDYTPEVHRYVIVAGCPFREVYRQRGDKVWWFKVDNGEGDYYRLTPASYFHKFPEWNIAISDMRTRIANGEPPDAFEPVERVAA